MPHSVASVMGGLVFKPNTWLTHLKAWSLKLKPKIQSLRSIHQAGSTRPKLKPCSIQKSLWHHWNFFLRHKYQQHLFLDRPEWHQVIESLKNACHLVSDQKYFKVRRLNALDIFKPCWAFEFVSNITRVRRLFCPRSSSNKQRQELKLWNSDLEKKDQLGTTKRS